MAEAESIASPLVSVMVLLLMAATKPSSMRRMLLVFSLMFSGTRTRLMAQFVSFPNAKPL